MKSFISSVMVVLLVTMVLTGVSAGVVGITFPLPTETYVNSFTLAAGAAVVKTPGFSATAVQVMTDRRLSLDINGTAAGYATDSTEILLPAATGSYMVYDFPIDTLGLYNNGTAEAKISVQFYRSKP